MSKIRSIGLGLLAALAPILVAPASAQQPAKPNILVIMGDDVGYWNIRAYNRGMMGYQHAEHRPHRQRRRDLHRLLRPAVVHGGPRRFHHRPKPVAHRPLKVGLPAAKEGLSDKDPTIADMLKPQGYATAQFGKNHLGDRNEFLPTVHGFDEFFGNLYHLNAEDEPEHPDYPEEPCLRAQFGPRGVMKCVATDGRYAGRRSPLWPMGQAEMRRHRAAHQEADGDNR